MSIEPPLRIFVASSAQLLTDHLPNGEGLIAHGLLTGLAERGHRVVVCAHATALRDPPTYEIASTGGGGHLESLQPLTRALAARRALRAAGGAGAFDVAWYLFPQSEDDTLECLPRSLPLAIGPWALRWTPTPPARGLGNRTRAAIRPLLRAAHRRSLERCHLLLSLPAARGVATATPRACHAVPFPVDAERFAATPVPPLQRVLFVGRLVPDKGIRELVEAFAAVRDALPGAELQVAGDGVLRGELEALATANAIPVTFLGPVAHAEVPALLRACSLFVLPSHHEPYGMAILEAMSTGRAVVAGDAGGPVDLVDVPAGGRRVPPGDAGALATALIGLLSDPQALRAAGAYNRARVEREFAEAVVYDKLERALATAAGR